MQKAVASDTYRASFSEVPSSDPENGGTLPVDERKALLKRAVVRWTREERARVRGRGEFDALLVRGARVNHRLHLVVVVTMAAVALGTCRVLGLGPSLLAAAIAVPCVYAAFWLFVALTGGEELEHIYIDERGKFTVVRSGRDPGIRGDFLRAAIPTALVAVSGWSSIGLIHDLAFPPSPNCDVPVRYQPGGCMIINLKFLPVGPSAEPAVFAPSTTAPNTAPVAGAVSVEGAKLLERLVRSFQLVVAVGILLPSIWFLRRMLTGRWVAAIRPIHYRPIDG